LAKKVAILGVLVCPISEVSTQRIHGLAKRDRSVVAESWAVRRVLAGAETKDFCRFLATVSEDEKVMR